MCELRQNMSETKDGEEILLWKVIFCFDLGSILLFQLSELD